MNKADSNCHSGVESTKQIADEHCKGTEHTY